MTPTNIIRRIERTLPDKDSESGIRTAVYQVGSMVSVGKENGKPIKKEVSNIVLDEDHYQIFVKDGDYTYMWKEIGRNKFTDVEYMIDL